MCGNGGGLVEWGELYSIVWGFGDWWHFGGVFEWYFNGTFNEIHWGSIWEFRWGVTGSSEFRMVGWGSLCSIRAPPVSSCFCM